MTQTYPGDGRGPGHNGFPIGALDAGREAFHRIIRAIAVPWTPAFAGVR